MKKKIIILITLFVTLFFLQIINVSAVTNSYCKKNYKSESTCNNQSECVWNTKSSKCIKFSGCGSISKNVCSNLSKCRYANNKCKANTTDYVVCSDYTKSPCNRQLSCAWNKAKKKCVNFSGCSTLGVNTCSNITAKCTWKNNYCETKEGVATPENTGLTSPTDIAFCSSTAKIWKIVGRVITILKIIIPVLLIIFGIIDFSQAAISSKDDQLMKAAKKLAFRAISGIIIYFLPVIASLFIRLIVNFMSTEAQDDYAICKTCVLSPSNCDTSNDAGNNILK